MKSKQCLEMCRLCQENPGAHKIDFDSDFVNHILECTRIDIQDVGWEQMPQKVCTECTQNVNVQYEFLQRCRTVDVELKSTILYGLNSSDGACIKTSITYSHDYNCSQCPVSLSCPKSLVEHVESHKHPNKYECNYCEHLFTRKKALQDHLKHHVQCSTCKIDFDSPGERKEHICSVKESSDLRFFVKIQADEKSPTSTEENKCEDSKKELSARLLQTEDHELVEEKLFLCVNCGKQFGTKHSLYCHEKIHLTIKEYRCNMCDLEFSVSSNLRSHKKNHHEGHRFYCSQCGRAFISKCSLDRHELVHTGIKSFGCANCPSAFYTNKELIKHQRYHKGIRSYQCNECFKTFYEKHHLTIHLRCHSGEKPYVCDVLGCGKAFKERQKLTRHNRTQHINKNDMIS